LTISARPRPEIVKVLDDLRNERTSGKDANDRAWNVESEPRPVVVLVADGGAPP
jgi:hypothetical protein